MSSIHSKLLTAALLIAAANACTIAETEIAAPDERAELALEAVTAKKTAPAQPIIDSDKGPPRLWIEPLDRTTAFDGVIRVGLRAPSASRARMVADLATRARIVTWPELADVASQPAVDVIANEDIADATVTLHPTSALAPRWYAVVVDVATTERPEPTLPVIAPGRVVSRFRVGSEPMVRQVQICDAGNGSELVVEYSEPVDAGARVADALDERGQSLCSDAAVTARSAKDADVTKRRVHRRSCAKALQHSPAVASRSAAIRVDGTKLVRSDAIAMTGCHVFLAP
jgi:hypothetical protein